MSRDTYGRTTPLHQIFQSGISPKVGKNQFPLHQLGGEPIEAMESHAMRYERVRKATIVGRERGVAPGASSAWSDRAPRLPEDSTGSVSPVGRQSVWCKTRRLGCL